MINVIIADDHPVVRAGVSKILAQSTDIRVTCEADSGESLITEIQKKNYDVVLLDISMPGISGIETLRRIKVINPDIIVLILSIHPEDQFASRTLRAGAAGYVTKASAPEELVRAIRQVKAGQNYISQEFAAKLAGDLSRDADLIPHQRLSDREFQVFCMITRGISLTEIGSELSLSVKTIGTYRTRILEKMQMSTNAELIAYAINNNFSTICA